MPCWWRQPDEPSSRSLAVPVRSVEAVRLMPVRTDLRMRSGADRLHHSPGPVGAYGGVGCGRDIEVGRSPGCAARPIKSKWSKSSKPSMARPSITCPNGCRAPSPACGCKSLPGWRSSTCSGDAVRAPALVCCWLRCVEHGRRVKGATRVRLVRPRSPFTRTLHVGGRGEGSAARVDAGPRTAGRRRRCPAAGRRSP